MMVIDGVSVSLDGMIRWCKGLRSNLKMNSEQIHMKREDARQAGKAPPVDLQATNMDALKTVDLDVLIQYDINNMNPPTNT